MTIRIFKQSSVLLYVDRDTTLKIERGISNLNAFQHTMLRSSQQEIDRMLPSTIYRKLQMGFGYRVNWLTKSFRFESSEYIRSF